ncbi:MAG: AtpZ/AtpI family protein [Chloroflexi bacterium]|nr:MAG: AtpZ/AtpI family protein [Chloroflexota bacterium]
MSLKPHRLLMSAEGPPGIVRIFRTALSPFSCPGAQNSRANLAVARTAVIIAAGLSRFVLCGGQVRWLWDFERAWELAWLIVVLTVGPLGAGVWLDRRLGTTPFFSLVGIGVGVVLTVQAVKRRLRS